MENSNLANDRADAVEFASAAILEIPEHITFTCDKCGNLFHCPYAYRPVVTEGCCKLT